MKDKIDAGKQTERLQLCKHFYCASLPLILSGILNKCAIHLVKIASDYCVTYWVVSRNYLTSTGIVLGFAHLLVKLFFVCK